MPVGLTIVLHGNKKVRDQRALEVISRLIFRPILHEQMHTYQNKMFSSKYVFLPLNQHKWETKENSQCVISFEENFPLGPF